MDGYNPSRCPNILQSYTMPRDQEYFEAADKYNTTDEAEGGCLAQRLRRVRRRPGVEQLGRQGNGPAASLPRMLGHGRMSKGSDLWDQTDISNATSLFQDTQQLNPATEERHKQKMEMQRSLWESTLPKAPVDHMGFFSTGDGLDCIHCDQST